MANLTTVEAAQFVLTTHLKRGSFLFNFFNVGKHLYEDIKHPNLEIKIDNNIYTIQNIKRVENVLNYKILTALNTHHTYVNSDTKKETLEFTINLAEKLSYFFNTSKRNKKSYLDISNFSSSNGLFTLGSINEQTSQFNTITHNYFKHIRVPGISTERSAKAYFCVKKHCSDEKSSPLIKEDKQIVFKLDKQMHVSIKPLKIYVSD
ncbi:hypothetical protein K9L67_02990 [Candidatus Woesearchaeota archaeon]|nr:hypothetical protein [Candidatus Woesearchaeota archaeon]MCF7901167.1 hypothetical protein [Candidatus Woesearchaeota archaeon]MCF8013819.1 hypothetical protein [Candidatus Woesearchaeota archaeon]